MCVIFLIYSDPSANTNRNMISLQKTNSCLLENNTKVSGNDEVDVINQMSGKYKEENIRDGPLFFCREGYLFRKKNCSQAVVG